MITTLALLTSFLIRTGPVYRTEAVEVNLTRDDLHVWQLPQESLDHWQLRLAPFFAGRPHTVAQPKPLKAKHS